MLNSISMLYSHYLGGAESLVSQWRNQFAHNFLSPITFASIAWNFVPLSLPKDLVAADGAGSEGNAILLSLHKQFKNRPKSFQPVKAISRPDTPA